MWVHFPLGCPDSPHEISQKDLAAKFGEYGGRTYRVPVVLWTEYQRARETVHELQNQMREYPRGKQVVLVGP